MASQIKARSQNMRLEGKVAVITGAGRGIGREIALSMAAEGAAIIVVDRDDGCELTAETIITKGGRAKPVHCDVSQAAAVRMLAQETNAWLGGVDILVNNAGITRDGYLVKMSEDQWDTVLTVNLKSVFLISREIIASEFDRKLSRIINISSVSGEMGNSGQVNYAASKAGLIGLTKTLAKELARSGVLVNAIAPGFIDTEMTRSLPDKAKEQLLSLIPLKRAGTPADIAAACVFLASSDASYITGQVLRVNGGMYV